jgi:hypothetical protein
VIEAARRRVRARPGLLAAGAGALALGVLAARDPHRHPGPLPCPVKALTGLDCPGCGGLRMTHALLHGDLRGAVRDNLLVLVAGPALAGTLARAAAEGRRPRDAVPAPLAAAFLGAALAWMVVRNLPGWPLRPRGR